MLPRIWITAWVAASMLFASASAEERGSASAMEGMSYAMQKSMDPGVWTKMMAMVMDPSKSGPMESCALCHESEDLARYSEQFGPMMDSMHGVYKSMGLHQAMQYMNPMMVMMNPNMMGAMNPMMYMNMMYPMMGMMGPMMNPMSMMGPMVNPMMMGGTGSAGGNPMNMMNPKQYELWFNQMTEMMKSFTPNQQSKDN